MERQFQEKALYKPLLDEFIVVKCFHPFVFVPSAPFSALPSPYFLLLFGVFIAQPPAPSPTSRGLIFRKKKNELALMIQMWIGQGVMIVGIK